MRCTEAGGGASEKPLSWRWTIYVFIHHRGSCVLKVRQFNRSLTKPTPWGSEGMKRTGEKRQERHSWTHGSAFKAHLCGDKKKKESIGGLCVWWLLFARRLWLMSLKGQTPLRKINGVSEARGNGLWGPAGHISNTTVITSAEQSWREWSEDGDGNVRKCWAAFSSRSTPETVGKPED